MIFKKGREIVLFFIEIICRYKNLPYICSRKSNIMKHKFQQLNRAEFKTVSTYIDGDYYGLIIEHKTSGDIHELRALIIDYYNWADSIGETIYEKDPDTPYETNRQIILKHDEESFRMDLNGAFDYAHIEKKYTIKSNGIILGDDWFKSEQAYKDRLIKIADNYLESASDIAFEMGDTLDVYVDKSTAQLYLDQCIEICAQMQFQFIQRLVS